MESPEPFIEAVVDALHERLPGFTGTLDGFDRGRVTAFVEAGDFGDPERLKEDVEDWARELAAEQQTGGDPLSTTALVVCTTIAYIETVRNDPRFPIKAVREVRALVETVLTDNALTDALLNVLKAWIQAGGPPNG
jgi:hypothetical protein